MYLEFYKRLVMSSLLDNALNDGENLFTTDWDKLTTEIGRIDVTVTFFFGRED